MSETSLTNKIKRYEPLEEALARDYLKGIQEKRKEIEEYVTRTVLEPQDYAERVGFIKATRELEDYFKELLSAYFPTE